jgi:arylsulfatase A-like enzyme
MNNMFFHIILCLFGLLSKSYSKTNLIIILCDDLGYGDVGFQGDKEVKTPNLDLLAKNGVILKQFYSAGPVCSPTRASILTGRHYYRTGIYDANVGRLRAGEHTLATTLSIHANYTCSMTGKWHLGALSEKQQHDYILDSRPWWHGFQHTFVTRNKVPTWNPYGPDGKEALTDLNPYYSHGERILTNIVGDDSAIIMDRAIDFIEDQSNRGNNFASFIWFHTPHLPCIAGPSYLKMYKHLPANKRHFFGAITAMDDQIGRLYKTLKKQGIENDTLIWFSSDNGPETHGGQYLGSTLGLRGRKRSLYNGGVTVPSFVHWPNKIAANTVVNAPLSSLDIYPTLLNIVLHESVHSTDYSTTLPTPKRMSEVSVLPLDGINAWDLLTQKTNVRNANIPFSYHHSGGHTHAIISYPYKLLIDISKQSRIEGAELYNIESDRQEKNNIAKQFPDIMSKLTDAIDKWDLSVKSSVHGVDYGLSPHSISQTVTYEKSSAWGNKNFMPDFSWNKISSCGREQIVKCIDPVKTHKKQISNGIVLSKPEQPKNNSLYVISNKAVVQQESSEMHLPSVGKASPVEYNEKGLVTYINEHIQYNTGPDNRYLNLPHIAKLAHSPSRIVFIAGIGGVGHHLFKELLDDSKQPNCKRTCDIAPVNVRNFLWKLGDNEKTLFTSHNVNNVMTAARKILGVFQNHSTGRYLYTCISS